MTEEQTDLALRLVQCVEFATSRGWFAIKVDWSPKAEVMGLPDLNDFATAAILLRMASEVANDNQPTLDMWAEDSSKWGIAEAIYGDFTPGDGDLGTAAARVLLAIWEKP